MSKEAMKLALEALEVVTKELLAVRDEIAERGGRPKTNAFHQRLWDSSFAAYTDKAIPAAEAIREALTSVPDWVSEAKEQPAQQEYERGFIDGMQEQMKRSVDRAVNAMAQQALDKMAENARELGLDYEPAQQEPNKDGSPCPEFWDWLPKAYNFDDNGSFTKYNMEVAFLAGKQASQPAQQKPVAWKLVPREPTHEMLKAMDECSTEGYDERLYAGHASSVYMAAVDAAPTPPAKRKPLTDEEIDRLWSQSLADTESETWLPLREFARAIEAAHGIKEQK